METQVLTLPQGQIKGVKRQSVYGPHYYSFEGIPYGKPPVGKLRFKAPLPAEGWNDVLDCTESPNKPVQINKRTQLVEGSEDCLYLNVFTKTLSSEKPLPVMVWIYGGGFATGKASRDHHGPDYLMREDVILVSFNYRLDALGFVAFSDPELEVPGNAALKDQVLALKWIKNNISHFNGDCENVTVFGESAGGAAAHYLLLTEKTRNCFQKAILMSGCALNYWAQVRSKDLPYRLAKYHGYEGENEDKLVLDYLQCLEAGKLVEHSLLTAEEQSNFIWLAFGPTVEPYESDDCVVPRDPLEMLKTAWSNEIPVMLGGVSFEGLIMYPRLRAVPQIMQRARMEPELILPLTVKGSKSLKELRQIGDSLLKSYIGEKKENSEILMDILHLCSHKLFWHGLYRTALARIAYAPAPTYLYRFDFDSPFFNHHRLRFCGNDLKKGVAHADDLSYLFFINESTELPEESPEYQTIQRMIGMWTSFAKNSDPNCKEIKPNIWHPITDQEPSKAMNISNEVEFMDLPDKSQLELWNNLYEKKDLY